MKHINLDKSYIVTIKGKTQVVESDSLDNAVKKARDCFYGRLYDLETGGATVQKCCKHTIIKEPLRFGFDTGWVTIHPSDTDTIYTMLDKAVNMDFVNGACITEIKPVLGVRNLECK